MGIKLTYGKVINGNDERHKCNSFRTSKFSFLFNCIVTQKESYANNRILPTYTTSHSRVPLHVTQLSHSFSAWQVLKAPRTQIPLDQRFGYNRKACNIKTTAHKIRLGVQ